MLQQLINQAKNTSEPTTPKEVKELEQLYVQIYDLRSGGRKVPKKVKILEIKALFHIDNSVNK